MPGAGADDRVGGNDYGGGGGFIGEVGGAAMPHPGQLVGVGLVADIRESIADAKTSLVSKPKEIEGDAQTSLLVSDDRQGGKKAFVVLIDASGNVVTKFPTVIGE
jgi:hypothetical protein